MTGFWNFLCVHDFGSHPQQMVSCRHLSRGTPITSDCDVILLAAKLVSYYLYLRISIIPLWRSINAGIMDLHTWIMDLHKRIMDLHKWIIDLRKSIMNIHNWLWISIILGFCPLWHFVQYHPVAGENNSFVTVRALSTWLVLMEPLWIECRNIGIVLINDIPFLTEIQSLWEYYACVTPITKYKYGSGFWVCVVVGLSLVAIMSINRSMKYNLLDDCCIPPQSVWIYFGR